MTEWICEYREEHDHVRDVPVGPACGAPATWVIFWLDGSRRWSPACDDHLALDPEAPPHAYAPVNSVRRAMADSDWSSASASGCSGI